ncbi:helix-turn-helix domain-containing protein [Enterococcus sp. LJL128]
MKIEELLDKKEAREVQLLKKAILSGGTVSEEILISYLGISKASLESDISELGYYLKPYEKDCRLFYDGRQVKVDFTDHFSISTVIGDYLQSSLKFQLINYLFQYREFTIVQLTTKFMISESSLFRKIKELNQLLKEFDIQIRNGRLKGEELQIRYFYFQIYWFLTPYEQHQKLTLTAQNFRIIEALEKALAMNFTENSKLKISLWLTISKKRIPVNDKKHELLRRKMLEYEQDPLYQSLRSFVIRFFSRYPIDIDENESQLHFVFLTSMFVLSEEDFADYGMMRGRRSPTSLADTFLLERVILYYRPQKFVPALEKKIFYYFSQIHNRLYFFTGELELFEQDNIWEKEEKLSGHHLLEFSHELLKQSLSFFGEAYQQGNSLHEWSLIKYLSVLAVIDFEMMVELQIGIDLKMDPLYRDVMTQVLMLSLKNINGVTVEGYKENKRYDLVITNSFGENSHLAEHSVYVLSELGSAYDISQIKKKIRSLYEKQNKSGT